MTDDTKPSFILETFIRASCERVWEALTDQETSAKFTPFRTAVYCSEKIGEAFDFRTPDGTPRVKGTILAFDPPSRLDRSFLADWMEADSKPSRCVYELEATGDTTKLTILHYGLLPGQERIHTGWSRIAASLKSFLESGEGLKFA